MKKLLLVSALTILPLVASAGYLMDSEGQIVHSNYNICVHTLGSSYGDGKIDNVTHFEYNKADFKGAPKEWECLVCRARERDNKVTITGHTDRIGSQKFNLPLSEKRAEAVKPYFIDNGVSVKTVAVGMVDPVVHCVGTKKTPELIKCLAPNRRAVVTVD